MYKGRGTAQFRQSAAEIASRAVEHCITGPTVSRSHIGQLDIIPYWKFKLFPIRANVCHEQAHISTCWRGQKAPGQPGQTYGQIRASPMIFEGKRKKKLEMPRFGCTTVALTEEMQAVAAPLAESSQADTMWYKWWVD
jgi:hypothetical protein